jgi:hypothetical protein
MRCASWVPLLPSAQVRQHACLRCISPCMMHHHPFFAPCACPLVLAVAHKHTCTCTPPTQAVVCPPAAALAGSLAALPAPGAAPSTTNLDVTALCALVSEVSWADPSAPELAAWAARTTHWAECLAAQAERPLLPELHSCLDGSQRLVASCAAVAQFERLLGMFAGPRETERWRADLLPRLSVYHPCADAGTCACVCGACAADGRGELMVYAPSPRVAAIPRLGDLQRAVLGLGDSLCALTVTANAAAVRAAEQQGTRLDVVLHRAVWLTGL